MKHYCTIQYFFDGTMPKKSYLKLVQTNVVPYSTVRLGITLPYIDQPGRIDSTIWFHHDGADPYNSPVVRNVCSDLNNLAGPQI